MSSPWSNVPVIEEAPEEAPKEVARPLLVNPLDYDNLRAYLIKIIDHIPEHMPYDKPLTDEIKARQNLIIDMFRPDADVPVGKLRSFATIHTDEPTDNALDSVFTGIHNQRKPFLCVDTATLLVAILGDRVVIAQ